MRRSVLADPYPWPWDASFSSQTTAFVVIDMQRDFCDPQGYLAAQGYSIESNRAIIPTIQSLLQAFRAAKFPIYHTREGHRPDLSTLSPRESFRSRWSEGGTGGIGAPGPLGRLLVRGEAGHDTIPELYPLPDEPVIDKPGKGAFAHTDFELLLRNQRIKNLVVVGVTTDVCVTTTVREASDRGFDCLVVADATAAVDEKLRDAALQSHREEGGIFGATARSKDILHALQDGGARS